MFSKVFSSYYTYIVLENCQMMDSRIKCVSHVEQFELWFLHKKILGFQLNIWFCGLLLYKISVK